MYVTIIAKKHRKNQQKQHLFDLVWKLRRSALELPNHKTNQKHKQYPQGKPPEGCRCLRPKARLLRSSPEQRGHVSHQVGTKQVQQVHAVTTCHQSDLSSAFIVFHRGQEYMTFWFWLKYPTSGHATKQWINAKFPKFALDCHGSSSQLPKTPLETPPKISCQASIPPPQGAPESSLMAEKDLSYNSIFISTLYQFVRVVSIFAFWWGLQLAHCMHRLIQFRPHLCSSTSPFGDSVDTSGDQTVVQPVV